MAAFARARRTRPKYVSLCAGPGGWCEGLRLVDPELAEDSFGIELDDKAVATRRAAGHRTGKADITRIGPGMFGNVRGLFVSPPCQTLSSAGKKSGRSDMEAIYEAISCIGFGVTSGHPHPGGRLGCGCQRRWLKDEVEDLRTALITEALHWAFDLTPEWLLFEQVPAALPLWEDMATELICLGYEGVDFGIVDAADYGVPQHRKRAVLIAHAYHPVRIPQPTHGPDAVLPYNTPASVLGLHGTLGFARRNDRDDGGLYRARDMRTTDRPSFTVTEKVRSWTYVPDDGSTPRKLTMAEVSQLQTFPADYPWQGSYTAACLQCANAVPPMLAAALIGAVTTPLAGSLSAPTVKEAA